MIITCFIFPPTTEIPKLVDYVCEGWHSHASQKHALQYIMFLAGLISSRTSQDFCYRIVLFCFRSTFFLLLFLKNQWRALTQTCYIESTQHDGKKEQLLQASDVFQQNKQKTFALHRAQINTIQIGPPKHI